MDSAARPLDLVVMVDDEKLDHMIYRRILARSGLVTRSETFPSAAAALDFLVGPEGPQVSLMFLDIYMPGTTGFDLLELIARTNDAALKAIPVYMLSTSLDDRDRARARSYGAVRGFISKPLTPEDLKSVVIRTRRELDEAQRHN